MIAHQNYLKISNFFQFSTVSNRQSLQILFKQHLFRLLFMKVTILALLILTVFAAIEQDTTVAYSGDNSTTVHSNQQANQTSGPSDAKGNQITTQSLIRPLPPQNWDFLKEKSIGGKAKWVTPTTSQKIYPIYWLTVYTINFTAICTKSHFELIITATGLFKVFLNNVLVQGWFNPWPRVANITLKPKCGHNVIKVLVFNYYYASPAAILYSLTQNTTGCYNCPAAHVYNKQLCACECVQNVFCLFNFYFDRKLCKCVPKCPQPLPCPKGKIWDAFNCQCICQKQPANCTGIAKWNPHTCSCFCVDVVLCIKGFHWDGFSCACVKTPLIQTEPTHPIPPIQAGPTLPVPPPKAETPTLPLPPPKVASPP